VQNVLIIDIRQLDIGTTSPWAKLKVVDLIGTQDWQPVVIFKDDQGGMIKLDATRSGGGEWLLGASIGNTGYFGISDTIAGIPGKG
jgi:hypothetical protein